MPLVELLNNLRTFKYYYGGPGNFTQKSIPYGYDQQGRQSSGEPYVRFPIPEANTNAPVSYYNLNRSSLDFPVRGGSLDYTAGGIVVSKAAYYDAQRISRFLKSTPKGQTFIAKQIGLQLTNPKLEVGEQANLAPGNTSGRFFGVIENTRIYNGGASTLAQVALAGSGVHVDRHGTVPYNPASTKYDRVVSSYNEKNYGIENRLVTLLNFKKYGQQAADTTRANLNRLGISRNPNLLFSYAGGPGSVYGIGLTTIPYFADPRIPKVSTTPVSPLYSKNLEPITQVGLLTSLSTSISGGSLKREHPQGYINIQKFNTEVDNRLTRLQQQLFRIRPTGTGPKKLRPVQTAGESADLNIPPPTQVKGLSGVGPNGLSTADDPIVYGSITVTAKVPSLSIPGSPINKVDTIQGASENNNTYIYKDENTTLWRAVDTSEAGKGFKGFSYNTIYAQRTSRGSNLEIPDFRGIYSDPLATNYQQEGMVKKMGVSNPGTAVVRNNKTGSYSTDLVSMMNIGEDYDKSKGRSDLIKFKFEAIEYFHFGADLEYVPIIFRAYLTNFQDTHTGEFTPFRYTGRGENFYTYNGFTRSIGFSLKIAIQSRKEMKPLYRKLNYLVSQMYPDYTVVGNKTNPQSGFMRAPLMRLTVGDYLVQQPGFISNIGITVNSESPWEINLEEATDVYQLPHIIELTCQYTPIHDFLPRRGFALQQNAKGEEDRYYVPPFITPNTSTKNNFGIG